MVDVISGNAIVCRLYGSRSRIDLTFIRFVTARKRSLRRLCFYRCLSFCPQGGGACVVASGVGHAWLLPGGCVVAPGGHVWLLLGGVCMVAPGGHAWLLRGGGGVRGIRRDMEIRSMSGRYASYWNAF